MINLIALAIPFFFVLIGIEVGLARLRGRSVYRFDDAITDLSCGTTSQALHLFTGVVSVVPYAWLYEHGRLWSFAEGSAVPWVLAFFGVDFAYYWWHRWTHETNLGWTTHVVHHQSEEYNLAVALRQSLTSSLSSWPFYLPMAVLGIPPVVYLTHSALNTLYQFWIHTELVGRTGPLEWVLNTPSHHRVHHAINPRYLDKNYAGVLIVWDRMFGTFVEEQEAPVYGTVKPLHSFDPLWANVQWAWLCAKDSFAAPSLGQALRVWVAPPGWRPDGLTPYPPPAEVTRASQVKYRPPAWPGLAPYVAVQFVPVGALLTGLLLVEETAPTPALAVGAALVFFAAWSWSRLFERRPGAVPLEAARLAACAGTATLALVELGYGGPALLANGAFWLGSLGWLWWLRR